jgi:hypothetical protein
MTSEQIPTISPSVTAETGTQPQPPISEEALDEWRWIMQERQKGTFDAYEGMHVAVYQQKILEASWDPILLRKYVALRDGIPAERIVLTYIERA